MEDTLKPDAVSAMESLRAMGIHDTVLLTGDVREAAHMRRGAWGLAGCIISFFPRTR